MTAKVRFLYNKIINIGHNSANSAVLQMLHNSLLCDDILEQYRQCTYNILLWHVQVTLHLLGYPNSLIPFHSKTAILWGFNITSNNNTYLGLHVKCLTVLPTFNQTWIFLIDFHESPPISNFMEIYPVGTMCIHVQRTDGHMDRLTDMMKANKKVK